MHSTDDMKTYLTWTAKNGQTKKKVRLLLMKLGTTEHNRFVDFIPPSQKKNNRSGVLRNG